MVNGSILRGAHDIAGAIGWMGMDRPTRRHIALVAGSSRTHRGRGSRGGAGAARGRAGIPGDVAALAPEQITAHDVFGVYAAGDNLAARVVANALECWGMAVANLVSLFDPEMVVLGGGLFGPAGAAARPDRRGGAAVGAAGQFTKVAVRVSTLGPRRA